MKMEDGDYTLRVIAPCFALHLTIYVCEFSEKDLMAVKTMLVLEPETGFEHMVVSHIYLHGEKLGFRYLPFVSMQY
jgi:hypothetical protein